VNADQVLAFIDPELDEPGVADLGHPLMRVVVAEGCAENPVKRIQADTRGNPYMFIQRFVEYPVENRALKPGPVSPAVAGTDEVIHMHPLAGLRAYSQSSRYPGSFMAATCFDHGRRTWASPAHPSGLRAASAARMFRWNANGSTPGAAATPAANDDNSKKCIAQPIPGGTGHRNASLANS
jgi:hypothetical protein